jgi:membrane protease YdiL (CAAX protease family)
VSNKSFLAIASIATGLITLSFALPAMQWLMGKLVARPDYQGLFSSIAIILCTGFWLRKAKAFPFQTPPFHWKVFNYLALIATLGLLIFNMYNRPISKITGQTKAPLEILDIIQLLPIAEEMLFRGAIWSMLKKFLTGNHERAFVLAGTSILFGIEHLGYWAQSYWPLPLDAYLHAISMIFAGIFFGFFRLKSDSLSTPVALHMLANGAISLFK